MDERAPKTQYLARFRRVLEHIEHQLDRALSLGELSSLASSSPFHFHRQFSSLVGVPVARYVQLRRLNRAVTQLAFRPDQSVLTIALDAGYESAEAFARAFRRTLGVSPSEFRRAPAWSLWHQVYSPVRNARIHIMQNSPNLPQVTIIDFPTTQLAVLEHRGSHDGLHASIQRFIAYRQRNRLARDKHATFNLVYDNPHTTEPDAFRMDICCEVSGPVEPNPEGVVAKTIPSGRCAHIRCQGGDDALEVCLSHLYGGWLPSSGESVRDFPLFFQRVRFFPEVPEHEAITDVFLPLQGVASR